MYESIQLLKQRLDCFFYRFDYSPNFLKSACAFGLSHIHEEKTRSWKKWRWKKCRIFLFIQLPHVPRQFTFGSSLGSFHSSTRVYAYICIIRKHKNIKHFGSFPLYLFVEIFRLRVKIRNFWVPNKTPICYLFTP